ncbi:MAG: NYN domain-containing protein [Candidatus Aureabacteria bacterium]|nr:NYN domain-containing protein [Candidatus Auribacterota bacterium]
MPQEPLVKRVFAFFYGQNLFYAAKQAFGYSYPNYDPLVLARIICRQQKWNLVQTLFYTGVPDINDNEPWHRFWTKKLAVMGKRGIRTFSRKLRYRNQTVQLADGNYTTVLVGQEKGVDIRIALDIVRFALEKTYDVALVFSQDQDLSEVADEIKRIAIQQDRWIKMACAFPVSPTYDNKRGINGTDWIRIQRNIYDTCLDKGDYR